MNIKIVGNGTWGNALFSVIKQNSPNAQIVSNVKDAQDSNVIILTVPTQAIRDILEKIDFSKDKKIILNTCKGIEKKTHLLPNQIASQVIKNEVEYFTLIGPGYAEEVKNKMPTLLNLGFTYQSNNIKLVLDFLQTDYFRVRASEGVEALELSGAFKNIYAISCGLSYGLGYGSNTQALLLTLAIEEISSLFEALAYKTDISHFAGAIGDLMLTCTSSESRNFTFGEMLANYSVEKALEKIQSTVEGYDSLSSIEYFKKQHGVGLPLATFVFSIIKQNNPSNIKKHFQDFVGSL